MTVEPGRVVVEVVVDAVVKVDAEIVEIVIDVIVDVGSVVVEVTVEAGRIVVDVDVTIDVIVTVDVRQLTVERADLQSEVTTSAANVVHEN